MRNISIRKPKLKKKIQTKMEENKEAVEVIGRGREQSVAIASQVKYFNFKVATSNIKHKNHKKTLEMKLHKSPKPNALPPLLLKYKMDPNSEAKQVSLLCMHLAIGLPKADIGNREINHKRVILFSTKSHPFKLLFRCL